MARNLKIKEWVLVIEIYKKEGVNKAANKYISITGLNLTKIGYFDLKARIKIKSKMLDNIGMKSLKRKPGAGRPRKEDHSDIPGIIDDLNEEQKRSIIEDWIKNERKKKNKKESSSKFKNISISFKSRIWLLDRTTFYKTSKQRIYAFDWAKSHVEKIFDDNNKIYGSRKLSILLAREGISISDRTLRNYMVRWGLRTKTRVAKRRSESKNTKVKYKDLVKRNYNPTKDNIVATDVSYIPANVEQNNVYLSVVISHKTKQIESWELSKSNDSLLVLKTVKKLKRRNYILHSDHGVQYSTEEVLNIVNKHNSKTSMSRVGNSLDNREVEYFFGCLKGEYLNHINTKSMSLEEINEHIGWYIKWYNTKRIQKRLQWKAPTDVSAYAI